MKDAKPLTIFAACCVAAAIVSVACRLGGVAQPASDGGAGVPRTPATARPSDRPRPTIRPLPSNRPSPVPLPTMTPVAVPIAERKGTVQVKVLQRECPDGWVEWILYDITHGEPGVRLGCETLPPGVKPELTLRYSDPRNDT